MLACAARGRLSVRTGAAGGPGLASRGLVAPACAPPRAAGRAGGAGRWREGPGPSSDVKRAGRPIAGPLPDPLRRRERGACGASMEPALLPLAPGRVLAAWSSKCNILAIGSADEAAGSSPVLLLEPAHPLDVVELQLQLAGARLRLRPRRLPPAPRGGAAPARRLAPAAQMAKAGRQRPAPQARPTRWSTWSGRTPAPGARC
jgi:hypothetical protein